MVYLSLCVCLGGDDTFFCPDTEQVGEDWGLLVDRESIVGSKCVRLWAGGGDGKSAREKMKEREIATAVDECSVIYAM